MGSKLLNTFLALAKRDGVLRLKDEGDHAPVGYSVNPSVRILGTLGSSNGKPSVLSRVLQTSSEDSVAFDPKGSLELARRVHAAASGTPYTYDELNHGGTPSPQAARLLLEDFATGLAIPHSLIEPGWKERLESIAAGKHVDPSFWQR